MGDERSTCPAMGDVLATTNSWGPRIAPTCFYSELFFVRKSFVRPIFCPTFYFPNSFCSEHCPTILYSEIFGVYTVRNINCYAPVRNIQLYAQLYIKTAHLTFSLLLFFSNRMLYSDSMTIRPKPEGPSQIDPTNPTTRPNKLGPKSWTKRVFTP